MLQWEPTFSNPFSTKPLTPASQFPALNATYAITSFQLSTALTWWSWGQRESSERDTYEMPAENNYQWDMGLFHGRWGTELDTDSINLPLYLKKMIASMFAWMLATYAASHEISSLSRCGKCSVSLNGINTLVTFRQPWHNCTINVTDSSASCSWLVLNHDYITVYMEDTSCNSVQLYDSVNFPEHIERCINVCPCIEEMQ